MNFGSLFSGIGGFDLGFERAGMTCAWQCEIDKHCQSLLTNKFGVKIYDDVRTIGKGNAEAVDVICGGFPCQDVSIAGKRAGFAGERSGLWMEFARIIEELKPGWVVVENVPGLLSSNQGRDFQTVLDQMVKSGYGVCWRILDSQYFGVAQRRRRVFIVGSLGNGCSAEVLFEREGVCWDPPARRKTGEGITKEVAGSVASNDPSRSPQSSEITQQLTSRMGTGGGNVPLVANTVGALQSRDCKGIGTTIDDKMVATSMTLRSGKEGGGKGYLGAEEKAMTLGGQQQFVGVRRLTPTECERLQGFPDGWTAGFSDSTRYKMLGNAVTVNVAEWIGKRIVCNQ